MCGMGSSQRSSHLRESQSGGCVGSGWDRFSCSAAAQGGLEMAGKGAGAAAPGRAGQGRGEEGRGGQGRVALSDSDQPPPPSPGWVLGVTQGLLGLCLIIYIKLQQMLPKMTTWSQAMVVPSP